MRRLAAKARNPRGVEACLDRIKKTTDRARSIPTKSGVKRGIMKYLLILIALILFPIDLYAHVIVDTSDIDYYSITYIGDFFNDRAAVLGVDLTWEFFPYSIEPDVLIHNLPYTPFSSSESEWLREWVKYGGTLVLIGENGTYYSYTDEIINELLGSGGFGLEDSIVPSRVVDSTRWILTPIPLDTRFTVDPNPRENLVFSTDSFAVFLSSYLVLGTSGKPLLMLGDSAQCEFGFVSKQPVASQIYYGLGEILLFADHNVILFDPLSPAYSIYLSYSNRDLLDRILLIGTYDIYEVNELPSNFALEAYPNPFNSSVTVSLSVIPGLTRPYGSSENPEIEIFDINGRMVAEIPAKNPVGEGFTPSRDVDAGFNDRDGARPSPTEIVWMPDKSLGSGVYLIRAKIGDSALSKRVVYLK